MHIEALARELYGHAATASARERVAAIRRVAHPSGGRERDGYRDSRSRTRTIRRAQAHQQRPHRLAGAVEAMRHGTPGRTGRTRGGRGDSSDRPVDRAITAEQARHGGATAGGLAQASIDDTGHVTASKLPDQRPTDAGNIVDVLHVWTCATPGSDRDTQTICSGVSPHARYAGRYSSGATAHARRATGAPAPVGSVEHVEHLDRDTLASRDLFAKMYRSTCRRAISGTAL